MNSYIYLHNLTGYCPAGYKYEWGQFEGKRLECEIDGVNRRCTSLSKEECRKACDKCEACAANEVCKSFEYKSGSKAKGCHLNSASHPNSPPSKEYIFCSKEG